MRKFVVGLVTAGLSLLASCSKDDDKTAPPAPLGNGTVQGVVVDGMTNSPIALTFDSETKSGVFLLVHGTLVPAVITANQANALRGLEGEYYLPNVPTDEVFPIIARVDGYEDFQGYVTISSLHPNSSYGSQSDIERKLPTLIGNIKLYPKGATAKDLSFEVLRHGSPLVGAKVQLKSISINEMDSKRQAGSQMPLMEKFQDEEFFLSPISTRLASIQTVTDTKGNAVIKGSDLVLGGHYQYWVMPADGNALDAISEGTVTVGPSVEGTALLNEPYTVQVDIQNAIPPLKLVSNSISQGLPSVNGEARFVFNRKIRIGSNTEDTARAILNSSNNFPLVEDIAGNKSAESVTLIVEGDTLILRPKFAGDTLPKVDVEPDLQVRFMGIFLQPAEGPDSVDLFNLETLVEESLGSEIVVPFFRRK